MSGLFGSQPASSVPDYTGLQIQTAVTTLPIPIVWGMSKLAPNVIWYNNFQTYGSGGKGSGKGGGGGGGGKYGSSSSETTYSASLILALCEGPIAGVNNIWKNQSVYDLSGLGLSLFTGTDPQSPWNYVSSTYPSQALGYEGTAYVCAANYSLGDSATLDNHNFEVMGLRYGTGYAQMTAAEVIAAAEAEISANGTDVTYIVAPTPSTGYYDADPALCINDFLTNAQFGVGFPSANIDATTLYTQGGGNDSSYQTYCRAIGLALSPCLTDQEQASSILARWLQLTNTAAVWSGGLFRFIPYGDSTVTNNGVTFTPNVMPIYNLGDDDFMVQNNEDPLQVSRSDPFEAYNVVRLEIAERDNAYSLTTIESRDQNAIEIVEQATGSNGMRIMPTVTAHEICDEDVASLSGQLILQRGLYIRNTYKFRLSWEYCLLDPMDLVTVTDAVLGLSNAAIRLTEIEEDENGFLQVTAEEFPLGVASAVLYPTQPPLNNPINPTAPADPVNPPIIFEPPSPLVSTSQVWFAVSGGSGGVADPNWGGCNVWGSADGNTFIQIGTVVGPSAQGVLSSNLPSYSDTNPDTTDTLAVNMAESGQALASGTAASAPLGVPLCIVASELMSYETATLTSANNYSLTKLYRGLYGTAVAAHSSGVPFALLNGAIFQYDLAAQYVGKELYFKFQSFNVFGGGVENLSSCAVYTYTPTGAAFDHPVARAWMTGTPMDMGSVTGTVGTSDDYGTPPTLPVELDVDLGAA